MHLPWVMVPPVREVEPRPGWGGRCGEHLRVTNVKLAGSGLGRKEKGMSRRFSKDPSMS